MLAKTIVVIASGKNQWMPKLGESMMRNTVFACSYMTHIIFL